MRVHANQVNPYAQLDAMYAAQKAEAKRQAARTRRKLTESASRLAGESDCEEVYVARVEERQETEEQGKRQNPQKQDGRKGQKEPTESGEADGSVSEWA